MSKVKVLVCGATGFIGRHMAERLAQRPDMEVTGTYFKTKPVGFGGRMTLVQADLTNKDQVNRLLEGVDVLVQAAAVTTGSKDVVTRPYLHVTDNAVMNSLLFRGCFEQKVKHVVFFSCTTMYPEQPTPVREEDFNHQIIDKYFGVGWTKVYIEKMCEFYSRIGQTRYTAIRHSNIYGPYDKFDLERSHVFGATVTKVMTAKNGKIVVWGTGADERDLLYISDLVDFVEKVIDTQKEPFDLVNVGYGQSVSVTDLVKAIIRVANRDISLEYDTSKPAINFKLSVNVEKAMKKYQWTPRVPLEEGIRKTLDWYVKNVDPMTVGAL
jgi:nucleoside-diphosphate-sugar epimerase